MAYKLLPDSVGDDRYRVLFDTTMLVRGTFQEQVTAIQTAIQTGIMTRNEGRALMGYPPIEGGDEVLIGPNMLPVEQNEEMANAGNETGTEPGDDDADISEN